MKRIAFIGCGNMAAALISGLIKGSYTPGLIWVANRSSEKLVALESKYPINLCRNNIEAVRAAEIIILAVKPQQLEVVCAEIAPALRSNQLLVSLAAGIELQPLYGWLPGVMVVRAMPNLAVAMQQGVIGFLADRDLDPKIQSDLEGVFKRCALCVWLDNSRQFNGLTAIAASGMAFYCLLSEYLLQAAESLGLPSDLAEVIIQKTELGTALLSGVTQGGSSSLRTNITSPGGTTEATLSCFYEGGFNGMVVSAVDAAITRANQLNTARDE